MVLVGHGAARSALLRLGAVGALAVLTACGGPAPLDPSDEHVVADSETAATLFLDGGEAAAEYFGAGAPLEVRTDTDCSAGTDNWKYQDEFRSWCSVDVSVTYALESEPWDSLPELADHLATRGWVQPKWFVDGVTTSYFLDPADLSGAGHALDDVTWIDFGFHGNELPNPCLDGTKFGLSFEPGSAYRGRAAANVVVASGTCEIAQQPW